MYRGKAPVIKLSCFPVSAVAYWQVWDCLILKAQTKACDEIGFFGAGHAHIGDELDVDIPAFGEGVFDAERQAIVEDVVFRNNDAATNIAIYRPGFFEAAFEQDEVQRHALIAGKAVESSEASDKAYVALVETETKIHVFEGGFFGTGGAGEGEGADSA